MQREISFANLQTHLHSCSFTQLKMNWMQLIEEFCTNTTTFALLWKMSDRTHFEQLQGNDYYYEVHDLYAPMSEIIKILQQMKWQERGYVQNLVESPSAYEELIQLILRMLEFRVNNAEAEKVQHRLLKAHVLELQVEDATVNELLTHATTSIKYVL